MKEITIMNTSISIETLFESMPVAMVLLNRNGEHVAVNQALASISGSRSEELIGRKVEEMSKESGRNIIRDFRMFDANQEVPDHEVVIEGKTFYVSVRPLRNDTGYAIGEMVALMDITKTKELEQQLEETNRKLLSLSRYDDLTGVLNPRTYYEEAEKKLLSGQVSDAPCSVLFLDLDHFKRINDTYGHGAGDMVLSSAAKCIRQTCRKNDLIGRVGGEEFSLFLPETGHNDAIVLAETLRREIEQMEIKVENSLVKITASIGVAFKSESHQSIADIQREADCAMYRAKQSGRNRVFSFRGVPDSAEGGTRSDD
ncbi:diguanylate cyclase [Oscillibacter sp. GMB15532]|uniref:sensor domain-containing diguanylate cyclase n=1 Tax=Oscillibacter sp. GMB15532 TaxID=3230022 RepID=UPI0034DFF012